MLKLTPARLALLRLAAEPGEKVYRCRDFDSGNTVAYLKLPGAGDRAVTTRVDELAAAGWLREGRASGPSWYARRPMLLTDAGREVLANTEKEN